MTTNNFEEWIRVQRDLTRAASDHVMAWYLLDDHNRVVAVDYREWHEWHETRPNPVIWDCTVGDVRIVTAFFGEGPKLFETAQCSPTSGFEVVEGFVTWAEAESGHRRRVAYQQAQ